MSPAQEFSAVTAGGARITARQPVRSVAERVLGRLWIDQVPLRLAEADPLLWEPAVGAEPCRPAQPGAGRELLPEILEVAARLHGSGVTEVVLIGAGVPAQAADVIAQASGAPLRLISGPDPEPVRRIASDADRLGRTAIVRTGDDPASEAVFKVLLGALAGLGLSPAEAAGRCPVIAEPGSPAARGAGEAGLPLFTAAAHPVFGAFSPSAMVPAALAGVDVADLLDQAADVQPVLARPERNPGLVLGAILGGCARSGRGGVVIGQYTCPIAGLGDWAARLLSGATAGRLLPIVQEGGLPVPPGDDVFLVGLGGRPHQDDVTVTGPLAAQLMIWEYAAAVAAYLVGVDPYAAPGAVFAPAVIPRAEPSGAVPVGVGVGVGVGVPVTAPPSGGPAAGVPAADDDAVGHHGHEAAPVEAGGETPDAGGEAPDAGGETPDAGGEAADAGGETVPAGAETVDAGEEPPRAMAAGTTVPVVPGSAVEVPGDDVVAGFETSSEVLDRLVAVLPADGHLTILSFLDPDGTAGQRPQLRRLAATLAARSARPVTVEWGFVNHSREKGVYLVLTGNVSHDLPVPDGGPPLGALRQGQALAAVRALRDRGRPVARLNLTDRGTGMAQLLEEAQGGA